MMSMEESKPRKKAAFKRETRPQKQQEREYDGVSMMSACNPVGAGMIGCGSVAMCAAQSSNDVDDL